MIVYYANLRNSFHESLDTLSSCLNENLELVTGKSYHQCPAFQQYIKNTFVVRSTYDYELHLDKEKQSITSPLYNRDFPENFIHVRNLSAGLISYTDPRFVFFAEKDLEMELMPAHFHQTLGRHPIVPGTFNIGKHFRPIECAIHFFHSDKIKIRERDPLFYVKFLTNEKIEFKKFFYNQNTLNALLGYFENKMRFTKKVIPLKWYYENSIRNIVLKEIKKNLI